MLASSNIPLGLMTIYKFRVIRYKGENVGVVWGKDLYVKVMWDNIPQIYNNSVNCFNF